MGGAYTEIDHTTTTIVLESATFDMYTIRKTAMKYGLFTDAVTRFNKGQSPLQTTRALRKACDLITELVPSSMVVAVADAKDATVRPLPSVQVPLQKINNVLGAELTAAACAQLLRNVECVVRVSNDVLEVDVPFWRQDLHIPEDIIEEIGRLHGYDRLPVELPHRPASATAKNEVFELKHRIREAMSRAGANEVLGYSFVHKNSIEMAGQDTAQAFCLSNAVSPDLQYYRLSVLPSLLQTVHGNVKSGYGQFAVYELGKVHDKQSRQDDGLPSELRRLGCVFVADNKHAVTYEGEAYYQARAYVEALAKGLGVSLSYIPFASAEADITNRQTARLFLPSRSAVVRTERGAFVGFIGEFTAKLHTTHKLPAYCAGFELDLDALMVAYRNRALQYQPLSKYPKVAQDITLQVPEATMFATVYVALAEAVKHYAPAHTTYRIWPLAIYRAQSHIRYSFRLIITSHSQTLTAQEVNTLLDTASESLAKPLNAVRI